MPFQLQTLFIYSCGKRMQILSHFLCTDIKSFSHKKLLKETRRKFRIKSCFLPHLSLKEKERGGEREKEISLNSIVPAS